MNILQNNSNKSPKKLRIKFNIAKKKTKNLKFFKNNFKNVTTKINNIINVVDKQNEVAFEQLSNLYLTTNDKFNYIRNQVGFMSDSLFLTMLRQLLN